MDPASRARSPFAPDREMFSDPARSTRFNFPTFSTSSLKIVVSRNLNVIVKMLRAAGTFIEEGTCHMASGCPSIQSLIENRSGVVVQNLEEVPANSAAEI
mmetsp:Transcript_31918/g.58042  ORF Transcript_31918/g.58042 Transcript_31918/m.58042 type:complete len:100 (-) Transcript_31918:680-979(-)